MSVFIVAEAGCNHLGDRDKMLALCDAAKWAGADAVKFQAYEVWALCERRGMLPNDCTWNEMPDEHKATGDLLMKAELTDDDLDAIAAHCEKIGLKWFASVFDPSQVERVLSRGACALKIGHAENNWQELLETAEEAAYDAFDDVPGSWACFPYVSIVGGQRPDPVSDLPPIPGYQAITPGRVSANWIHCVPEYPATSDPELGLIEFDTREAEEEGAICGFSSHYTDYRIPAAAALRGAEYIEFHIATEPDQPEVAWSLMPDDAKKCCELIREYESWL